MGEGTSREAPDGAAIEAAAGTQEAGPSPHAALFMSLTRTDPEEGEGDGG